MYTICWSPKGGSGTTVTAITIVLASERGTLIDLAGDAPAAIGIVPPAEGVHDWMRSGADADRLDDLVVDIDAHHRLIASGSIGAIPARRWMALVDHLTAMPGEVVVDVGTTTAPPAALARGAARRLMVVRPCYLALRRAAESGQEADGIVLVAEPGRALSSTDVERCLSIPVVAEVAVDPSVARAVDAGLLACRRPRSLAPLARLAR